LLGVEDATVAGVVSAPVTERERVRLEPAAPHPAMNEAKVSASTIGAVVRTVCARRLRNLERAARRSLRAESPKLTA
jgi:hypothetical protein